MAEFRVIFTAADYDATVAFFTDTMGLDVLRSWTEGGRGTILLAAAGQIEVFADDAGWGSPGVQGVRLAWEVDDADASCAELRERGAEILREDLQVARQAIASRLADGDRKAGRVTRRHAAGQRARLVDLDDPVDGERRPAETEEHERRREAPPAR